MGTFVECVARRLNEPAVCRLSDGADWRAGAAPARAWHAAAPVPVLLADEDPMTMATRAAVALAAGRDVFLGNPRWTTAERAAAEAIVRLDPPAAEPAAPSGGRVMLATGGSGGALRFAIHTPETLAWAAEAFRAHFGFRAVHSLCLLPLHHVSGFQQLVRALVTNGTLLLGDWPAIAAGIRPARPAGSWVLSLVPAQLQRLIGDAESCVWLRGFAAIFLGGAPAGPELLERARIAALPLAPAYGATETAAQCAAQTPAEFAAGLPGLRLFSQTTVSILDLDTGEPLPAAHSGRLEISAAALFHGYWPAPRDAGPWQTDDLGFLDTAGRLHVVGRVDAAINTGGEKVQPGEVEAALRATGALSDVVVLGVPDERWGECVAAFFPAADAPDPARIAVALRTHLSPHKIPRRWIPVADWPRNEQGKVSRAALRRLAADASSR